MKVQNGVQPLRLRPVQSSDDAINPKGIIARNGARTLFGKESCDFFSLAVTIFDKATASAAITSNQNAIATNQFISSVKSMANLESKKVAIANAA